MGTRQAQAGKGCSTLEDEELREKCNSLFQGKHSYRTWDETSFGELYDACEEIQDDEENYDCRITVRRALTGVESGRWEEAMNEMHRFVSALDTDEMNLFAEKHPRMAARIKGYAKTQSLNQFSGTKFDDVDLRNEVR